MKPSCPYCHTYLEKAPTRKKQCPHCGNDIYVRKAKLLTHKEAIFQDARAQLLGMSIKGVGRAKTVEDIWEVLIGNVKTSIQKKDFRTASSLYLQMGVISFAENNYVKCIEHYLLCSHFSAIETIARYREIGIELTFDDLMSLDNSMITSPVISSLEQLKIDGLDTYNLGVLGVTPFLTLTQKMQLLSEAFIGNVEPLTTLSDRNLLLVKEEPLTRSNPIEISVRNQSGCIGVFLSIFLLILVVI